MSISTLPQGRTVPAIHQIRPKDHDSRECQERIFCDCLATVQDNHFGSILVLTYRSMMQLILAGIIPYACDGKLPADNRNLSGAVLMTPLGRP
jgi:hypothetical protein